MSSRVLVGPRGTDRSWQRVVRSAVWLALLVALAVRAWEVTAAHQERVQGIPEGFPAPVREADVPALGVNAALEQYDDQELESVLARIAEDGFVWVRQAFIWSEIDPGDGDYDWSTPDRVVAAVGGFPELRLVAVVEDDPPAPPDDPDRFAAFVGAFAARYGDEVEAYQIWDEPNLAAKWGGGPVSPIAYGDLLGRTAPAIRAADPDARILLAGLAPTTEAGPENLSEVRYLERLYQAGAASTFDVVAAKPYGFNTGPGDRRVDESILNFSRILLLRQAMVEHGDGDKAIWASHWGWNALPEDWDGAPSIWGQTDDAMQASWTVAALERARREWPWVGAMIIENLQAAAPDRAPGRGLEDPRWGFSLLDRDGSPRPVYDAVSAWSRTLPDAAGVGGYGMDTDWAEYEGDWRVGALGTDPGRGPTGATKATGNRTSFRFDGTRVALTVRRGPYRGFLTVTVDGEPANALPRDEEGCAYVVLYDREVSAATVPVARGLEPGPHTVEVTIEGGEGQWPLIDWRVGPAPVEDGWLWELSGLAVGALMLGVVLAVEVWRVDWSYWSGRFLSWPERAQTGLVVGLSGLFWGASSLAWGQSGSLTVLPGVGLVVSLLAIPFMVVLLALRLDVGLALVAFAAPFYLVPSGMFYQALALPEILVILCVVAYGVSRLGGRPWQRWGRSSDPGDGRMREMDYAVALLVVAALVASGAAEDRAAALFELRAVFVVPALAYALLRVVRPDERVEGWIVDGFVLGGLGVALVGLGQGALGRNLVAAEGGLPRLQSVYHSPNNVGLYLGRVWPLLGAVAVLGQGWRRKLYGAAWVPVTAAVVLSFSRGALLLGLPAAILVMGWLAGGRFRRLAVVALLLGGLALVPLVQVPRFATLLDLGQGSTFFRLKLWRSSVEMVREHPLFGLGPGNFLQAYRTRYVLPTAWEEFNLEHAHQVVLDHWTRLGLLGLLAGVAVQLAFWRTVGGCDRRDPRTLGLAGGMAALLAHGLVDNTVFFPDLALALFLMLGLVGGDRGSRERSTDCR